MSPITKHRSSEDVESLSKATGNKKLKREDKHGKAAIERESDLLRLRIETSEFRVRPGETVDLSSRPTALALVYGSKKEYQKLLKRHVAQLTSLQRLHYASGRYALMVIFEGVRLFQCDQFGLDRIHGDAPFTVGLGGEPRVLVCLEGDGQVQHDGAHHELGKGNVMLLPASVGACSLLPSSQMTVLEISIPNPS